MAIFSVEQLLHHSSFARKASSLFLSFFFCSSAALLPTPCLSTLEQNFARHVSKACWHEFLILEIRTGAGGEKCANMAWCRIGQPTSRHRPRSRRPRIWSQGCCCDSLSLMHGRNGMTRKHRPQGLVVLGWTHKANSGAEYSRATPLLQRIAFLAKLPYFKSARTGFPDASEWIAMDA